mmetsp:Transcript_972/g.1708  ORF Transcript_972/g.1708 Transcript_972/m.1708 type:complete len:99 (+) Transcript_972:489-785(+)
MASLGNDKAEATYGGKESRPPINASDDIWKHFIVDKYEKRKYSKIREVEVADLLNLDDKAFSSDQAYSTDDSKHFSTLKIKTTQKIDRGEDFFSQYGV